MGILNEFQITPNNSNYKMIQLSLDTLVLGASYHITKITNAIPNQFCTIRRTKKIIIKTNTATTQCLKAILIVKSLSLVRKGTYTR